MRSGCVCFTSMLNRLPFGLSGLTTSLQETGLYILQSPSHCSSGVDVSLTTYTNQTLLPTLLFTTSADTPFPSTPTDANLPPGTLDLTAYEFSDAKLGIVFESAEMVRCQT